MYLSTLWKVPLFVGHGFIREGDNKCHLKFYMTKAVLPIYRMMPRMLSLDGRMTDFCLLRISRWFGTWCRVQRSMQHSYTSRLLFFNNHFILLRVEFEGWLSVPALKTGQLFTKLYNWNRKVSKKSQTCSNPASIPLSPQTFLLSAKFRIRPILFHARPFSKLGGACQEFPNMSGTYSKV
jgi:hypothetical protein